MPAGSATAREGLIMAVGVLAITSYFSWRQFVDRATRDDELTGEDMDYYSRRDSRRILGISTLGLIGIGMLAGSLIVPRVHPIAFVSVWLIVGLLVCVSLILALLDMMANHRYAKRHLHLLSDERKTLLQEEMQRHLANQNGHGEPLP